MNSTATLCVRVSLIFKNVFFFFLFSLFFVRFVVAHVRLHPLVCVLLTQITSFSLFLFLSFVLCVLSFATEEDKSTRRKKSMSYIVLWASSIYLTAIEIHYTRHFSFSIIIIEIYIFKKIPYLCLLRLAPSLFIICKLCERRRRRESKLFFSFFFFTYLYTYI
jgi:hypothetical protein